MRIFHLVPNLNYGGLQEIVRGLVLCQATSGLSVTVGCWTNESNHPEAEHDLERAGASVVYLRRSSAGRLSYGRMAQFKRLKCHLGAGKADILHVHNPFGYYIYGAIAARLAGRTAIVNTVHATVMFDNPRFGRRAFWCAAMLSDGLVSVCSEVETALTKRFALPRKKLFVVENGIELRPFLAVPGRPARGEIVFGAVGRMSREKNHRLLIEAFTEARRNHPTIRLRLLGAGPLELELKKLAGDLGSADAVEFCGYGHDVPAFLADIDVFVLPSNSEGMPLSLLEAIASGLPVVATKVGGVPRIVQNTDSGWLCEPQNVGSLITALESAVSSTDRRERGERARHLVGEQYSAARMTRDYQELYRKLLH